VNEIPHPLTPKKILYALGKALGNPTYEKTSAVPFCESVVNARHAGWHKGR